MTIKRIFDLSASLLGLLLASPFFLIISVLIKSTTSGPAFFIQKRVGEKGRLFNLYKFRTMIVSEDSEKEIFEPGDISRVTKIGKFLRRTKLDELPQLLNVIKGDLSIVGPRPEVEKWVLEYPERWKRVLSVKPGITDSSSIAYRDEEALLAKSDDPEKEYKEVILPKKLDFYEDYVKNNSFFGDIKLIFKTLCTIILK